jgi:hypothetical protein
MRPLSNLQDLLWGHLIPNMRMLFMIAAPEKYYHWQGNCCRQAATLSYMAAVQWYGFDKRGGAVVDREFTGRIRIKPNTIQKIKHRHAYLWLLQDNGRILTVDMALRQPEPVFLDWTPDHPYDYPWTENQFMAEKQQFYFGDDIVVRYGPDICNAIEYYTGMTGQQIYDLCMRSKPPTQEQLNELRNPHHFIKCAG